MGLLNDVGACYRKILRCVRNLDIIRTEMELNSF